MNLPVRSCRLKRSAGFLSQGLFDIDSDFNVAPAEYRALANECPDVLLVPEWSKPKPHHAYAAPLEAFVHRGETGAAPSIRDICADAFHTNVLDGFSGAKPVVLGRVLKSFKEGDIACINAWYPSADSKVLGAIFADTKTGKSRRDPAGTPAP